MTANASSHGPAVSPAEAHRLKGASRLLIAAAGGLEAAAATLGMGTSQLSRYQTVGDPNFMPLDKAAALESLSDVPPHATRALAALRGHALVELPPGAAGDWAVAWGQLAQETGEVLAALGQALKDDGQVSAEEVRRLDLIAQIDEAESKLATLRAMTVRLTEQRLPPALRAPRFNTVGGGKP